MKFNEGVESSNLVEPSSWSWPVQIPQVPLQQTVDGAFWPTGSGEHAPSQLPMFDPARSKFWMDAEGVDAPPQFQMDLSEPDKSQLQQQPVSCSKPNTNSTLRRRRGHDSCEKDKFEMQPSETCANYHAAHAEDNEIEQAVTVAETARARLLVDKLLEQLTLGDSGKKVAIESFGQLAFDSKTSSRAAQMALAEASANDAVALSSGLHGKIRDAVHSKHANYVVQKILEVMPVARASFVVEELVGAGRDAAQHPFGCRILCRILEHGSLSDSATSRLIEEILQDAKELSNHTFGSFVIRHILEFGLPEHRQKIVTAISSDLMGHAKHRQGSHVVEAALHFSSSDDQQLITERLIGDKSQLLSLTASQFGRHVVKALLAMKGELRQEVIESLRPLVPQLQARRYGKSVIKEVRAASS